MELWEEPKHFAALAAFVGVILSGGVSIAVAWITARRAIHSERTKRQSDLALKIAEMVSVSDEAARRAAMRRFAVAVVKIIEPKDHEEAGNLHFIPMNSRVTVGRDKNNDIVFENDAQRYVSRWHCGFIADQEQVWLDDYHSTNGTKVGGKRIQATQLLKNRDEIELGPYKLLFQLVHKNTILSQ